MTARRRIRLVLVAQRCFLEYFVAGTSARSAAEIIGVNRNTTILFYRKLWEIIAGHNAPEEKIEVDESHFGGYRKDKRARGTAGKVAVFGLLKRGGHVHAVMIPNAGSGKREAGSPCRSFEGKYVQIQSFIQTYGTPTGRLISLGSFMKGSATQALQQGRNHINGIVGFWKQAKHHLTSIHWNTTKRLSSLPC